MRISTLVVVAAVSLSVVGCKDQIESATLSLLGDDDQDGGTEEVAEAEVVDAGMIVRRNLEQPVSIVPAKSEDVFLQAYDHLMRAQIRHFERSKGSGSIREMLGWCLLLHDYVIRAAALSGESPYELAGIAARESSCGQFITGKQVGKAERRAVGPMQIFDPPNEAVIAAKQALGVAVLDWHGSMYHNVVLGAFVYQHYQRVFGGSKVYALLAYHGGPNTSRMKVRNETGTYAEFKDIVRWEACRRDESDDDCRRRKDDIQDYVPVVLGYAHLLKVGVPEYSMTMISDTKMEEIRKRIRKNPPQPGHQDPLFPGVDVLGDSVLLSDDMRAPNPVTTAERGTVMYTRPDGLSLGGVADRFRTSVATLVLLNGGMPEKQLSRQKRIAVPAVETRLTQDVVELSRALYGFLPIVEAVRMFRAVNPGVLRYQSPVLVPILPPGELQRMSGRAEKLVNASLQRALDMVREADRRRRAAEVPIESDMVSWQEHEKAEKRKSGSERKRR